MMAYIRSKNPKIGLYYAAGPTDFNPYHKLQLTAHGDAALTNLDEKYNTGTAADTASSLSADAGTRTKFKNYGFYMLNNPITTVT